MYGDECGNCLLEMDLDVGDFQNLIISDSK